MLADANPQRQSNRSHGDRNHTRSSDGKRRGLRHTGHACRNIRRSASHRIRQPFGIDRRHCCRRSTPRHQVRQIRAAAIVVNAGRRELLAGMNRHGRGHRRYRDRFQIRGRSSHGKRCRPVNRSRLRVDRDRTGCQTAGQTAAADRRDTCIRRTPHHRTAHVLRGAVGKMSHRHKLLRAPQANRRGCRRNLQRRDRWCCWCRRCGRRGR